MSPTRRREAVDGAQRTLEVSERRACKVLRQPRGTQRYRARRPDRDRLLVQRMPGVTLRGDANYDAHALYAAVADRGGRLVTPRRKPGTGLGHHRQHPDRLRAIVELEQVAGGGQAHRRHRCRIEQCFGHLTNLPFGLSPLPNWVRRLKRVKRWVTVKITLYHLYLSLRQPHASVA